MSNAEISDQGEVRIDGVAAAALVAAGFGAFVLGFFTTLNEASSGVSDFLRFNDDVGPLSGKTILAAIAYFGSLLVLGVIWRSRQIRLTPVLWTAGVLLVLGLVGTFPTFFEAFADD
ncbi:MAG: hypothetical protein ACRDPX_01140 [Gaiellaceae bacterium]|jgi:hypothetical protein